MTIIYKTLYKYIVVKKTGTYVKYEHYGRDGFTSFTISYYHVEHENEEYAKFKNSNARVRALDKKHVNSVFQLISNSAKKMHGISFYSDMILIYQLRFYSSNDRLMCYLPGKYNYFVEYDVTDNANRQFVSKQNLSFISRVNGFESAMMCHMSTSQQKTLLFKQNIDAI